MNDNPFAPPRDDDADRHADATTPADPTPEAAAADLNDTAPLPPNLGDTAPLPRMDDAPGGSPVTEQLASSGQPDAPALAPTQPMPVSPTQPMPVASAHPASASQEASFNAFAPPATPAHASAQAAAAQAAPPRQPAFGQPVYAQPPVREGQPVYAQPRQAAGAQGAPHAAASPQDSPFGPPPGSGHRPAAPPQPKPRGRVPGGVIAAIIIGALLVGGAAGFGGAYAFDRLDSDSGRASSTSTGADSATLPDAGSSSIVTTDETTVAAIAADVMPSVVSIENIQGGQAASEGSGFIIREDGYILTNNHVIEGSDDGTVTVVMSDGNEYQGEVVGATGDYDLAVVKIDAEGLTPLVLGDSDQAVVGEDVIAVGSPLGLESTVTTGIVSALHRPVTAGDSSSTAFIDAIQTDAAINPGNSGGPLINSDGEVIGINSAIASLGGGSAQAGSVGLGFAIPSNQARRTAEEIIATGEATYPVVGVMLDSSYTGEGVKVAEEPGAVAAGGPADEAGIEEGDIITAIDGRPITRSDELIVAIRAKAPDDTVTLTVRRGEEEQDIDVTLVPNTDVTYGDGGEDEQPGGDGGGNSPDPSE